MVPEIDKNGKKMWINTDGNLHREDGPACEWNDGAKEWHINGKCHREDGPAMEWEDGTKRWYIRDNDITDKVEQWIKDNNLPDYKEWDDNIKVLFKLTFG